MKTIQVPIPDGKEAKWVNDVLTLVDEQPKAKFKFNIGDKVTIPALERYGVVVDRYCEQEKLQYDINCDKDISYRFISEYHLEPYTPQDITERIKTFEDACQWCRANKKSDLVFCYELVADAFEDYNDNVGQRDILAYLKLRIITCALNEGWEPTFEEYERRYYPEYSDKDAEVVATCDAHTLVSYPSNICFKSAKLVRYAGKQFKDIYMDFCYKGKE